MGSRGLIAALTALVGLFLLAGGSTTGAFWKASESTGAGTIRTGTLDLLSGDADTQVQDYAFDELTATNMSPGSFAQAPLTLTNSGTAPMGYRLEGWLVSGDIPQEHLLLTATLVDSALTCSQAGTGPQPGVPIDPLAPRPLAWQQEEVWCVRLTLAPDVPRTVSGAAATAVLTFRAEQTVA